MIVVVILGMTLPVQADDRRHNGRCWDGQLLFWVDAEDSSCNNNNNNNNNNKPRAVQEYRNRSWGFHLPDDERNLGHRFGQQLSQMQATELET
jgi:hypothetical protein